MTLVTELYAGYTGSDCIRALLEAERRRERCAAAFALALPQASADRLYLPLLLTIFLQDYWKMRRRHSDCIRALLEADRFHLPTLDAEFPQTLEKVVEVKPSNRTIASTPKNLKVLTFVSFLGFNLCLCPLVTFFFTQSGSNNSLVTGRQ